MANLHEIKAHIANVNSTKKITRAMYLISASKSQKAKAQLATAAPYFQHIKSTMAQILACADALDTPYIRAAGADDAPDMPQSDLYLVIAGDKGMAGGYNNNLLALVNQYARKNVDDLIVAGFVGRHKVRQLGYHVDEGCIWPVMNPSLHRAREMAEYILHHYLSFEYRRIYVIYSEMVTALKQQPTLFQLLPLDVEAVHAEPINNIHTEEFLPSARVVFDHLVPHYLKGILYSALVEAFTSEQSARMFAMDGATKSANETIDRLSIAYNRARQARITQELTEIISGIPQE